MSNKIMTNIKNIGIVLILLFGIISCEKDFEDIAIDLVGNNKFTVGKEIVEVIAYNVSIEKERVDNNNFDKQPLSLLGVNSNDDFGYLKATLISQLSLPITGVDFGDNPIIDLVVLDIPYLVKDTIVIKEITVDNDTIYETVKSLDSIYGNREIEYNITVNELGTFLNVLDPLDPTKGQEYYSDRDYQLKDQIYSDNFKPNVNDTVLYVNRNFLYPSDTMNIDTIKGTNLVPSIKLILDSNFFKTRFVDHDDSSDFSSNANFRQYFRGLHIDPNGADGSLMNLNISGAKTTIYYTNEEIKDEGDDEDLNFNGVKGEDQIVVKIKQAMHFALVGVKSNKYERDYTSGTINSALLAPDVINGEEKLYVQGAAGSEIILDLFPEDKLAELEELRDKNWLINDAILTFYIDGIQEEVPQQLLLYNYAYNSYITDMNSLLFGPDVFGGKLEYKRELILGSTPPRYKDVPEKYTFRITKYISELLDTDNPKAPTKLGLKNYVNTDAPINVLDTLVKPYNWIPKGVILNGNLPENSEKRIKLEIFYSK
ncbi:MAG: DUF4270 domain-containing protein [Flavobacteriaceae bacterium]|nr:DUF4270 domain-containing protein [Flavobacteriaceae bacterium]